MKTRTFFYFIFCAAMLSTLSMDAKRKTALGQADPVIVAYVTSWSSVVPDPFTMTHINYAFGHVTDSFDGVRVDNPDRLRQMVELKQRNSRLKVLLSVGGWGSGRFSEMVTDPALRHAFAKDCRRVVDEYGLDGIDIDWEYPTSNAAGISSAPTDKDNYTLLMHDIRQAIGEDKELTLASVASADYIDFPAIKPYIDFVNIMAYDMGNAPVLHSGLFPSDHTRWMTSSQAVDAHIAKGIPGNMLVMGMPFYGRGGKRFKGYGDYKNIEPGNFVQRWDSIAMVPYLADPENGELVFGYDNAQSLAIKCQYIKQRHLRGAMYWDYSGDDEQGTLRNTVYANIMNDEIYLFVGSYAPKDREGLRVYRFNQQKGTYAYKNGIIGLSNPSFLCLNKEGNRLYCVGESSGGSSASSVSFDRLTGDLRILNTQLTKSDGPCHITLSPDEKYIYTANYSGGAVSRISVQSDGKLDKVEVIPFTGSSVNPERQTKPYLHAVYFSPDGKYMMANDLGTDKVHVFRNGTVLKADKDIVVNPGAGPRHLCWAPNGKYAYLIGELSGEIFTIKYNGKKFKVIQSVRADSLDAGGSADIHLTSDGKFVYASHRLRGDGISIYRVQKNGTLSRVGYQPTGTHPRNFIITPNDRYVLVACRDTNEIQIFFRNAETGLLSDTGNRIAMDRPVCLKWFY